MGNALARGLAHPRPGAGGRRAVGAAWLPGTRPSPTVTLGAKEGSWWAPSPWRGPATNRLDGGVWESEAREQPRRQPEGRQLGAQLWGILRQVPGVQTGSAGAGERAALHLMADAGLGLRVLATHPSSCPCHQFAVNVCVRI